MVWGRQVQTGVRILDGGLSALNKEALHNLGETLRFLLAAPVEGWMGRVSREGDRNRYE